MNDSMHINTEKDCSTVICISYEYDYFMFYVFGGFVFYAYYFNF